MVQFFQDRDLFEEQLVILCKEFFWGFAAELDGHVGVVFLRQLHFPEVALTQGADDLVVSVCLQFLD